MKPRRLKYRYTGEGLGPRRGSLIRTMTSGGGWAKGQARPTGTVYRVLRVVTINVIDPRVTVFSLVVARVFEPKPRKGRGVFDMWWDPK